MNNRMVLASLVIFTVLMSIGTAFASDVNGADAADASSIILEDNVLCADSEASGDSSFADLNSTVNSGSSVIDIITDYTFNAETDMDLKSGITIENSNIVINGNNHIIDAKGQSRIFNISGNNITINNLIIKNGNDSAILLHGGLTTSNVEFVNCSSDDGAAVYASGSTYVSENDRFIDNFASDSGSAIFSTDSNLTVSNGLFKSNKVQWALLYGVDSNVTVINTTFANTTSKYASAIYSSNNRIYIKKSWFTNLFANLTAGAIGFKAFNDVAIEDCEFINVSSDKNGGAIFADVGNGTVAIDNCLFEDCKSGFGGAYLQLGGELELTNSNFTNNHAEFDGGAVYFSDADANIESCIFTENGVNTSHDDYPTYGGAVFSDLSALTVFDCRFDDNTAVNGSAIYCYDTNYSIDEVELNGNDNNAICTFFDIGSEIGSLYGTDTVYDVDLNNTFYPSVVETMGMELEPGANVIITELPSKYDLREENLVSPVKDQGNMGACWAFGMYGSLESVLLKAMNYSADFSENNMQNSMLVYSKYAFLELYGQKRTEGGFNVMSMAYLLSWLGAFPNDYDTYDELGKISPIITTENDVHIQDIILIRNTPGDNESIKNIKEAIYKYGAVCGYLLSKASADDGTPTGYFNENTSAEYIPEHLAMNHAIAVVGWDDDFSRDNFLIKPPADGAWIIKNSWGSNWADGGYFYVSYYDETLCANPDKVYSCFAVAIVNNTIPYNKNYQYDFSGLANFFHGGVLTYSNSYKSIGDDLIAAVGTYFEEEGTEYTVEIAVNGVPVYTQSGVSPYYGYHTIKLDKYISIKKGDVFTASITALTVPICDMSRVHYQKGSSIISAPDGSYDDLASSGMVACLKVYTLADDTVMVPLSDVSAVYGNGSYFSVKVMTADGHPVVNAVVNFTINDVIYEVSTDEYGIATFEIPALDPGNYTLTITYNNQTINVAVKVNATSDDNGNVTEQAEVKNVSAANSKTELHPSGNPISMVILSVLAVIGLGFRRKYF